MNLWNYVTGGHFSQQWGREPEAQIVTQREELASTAALATRLTLGPHHSLLAILHLSVRLLVQLLRGRIPKDNFQTTRYITKVSVCCERSQAPGPPGQRNKPRVNEAFLLGCKLPCARVGWSPFHGGFVSINVVLLTCIPCYILTFYVRSHTEECTRSLLIFPLSCDLRSTYFKGKTCKTIVPSVSFFTVTESRDINWSWGIFIDGAVDLRWLAQCSLETRSLG